MFHDAHDVSYTTAFPNSENPLRDASVWHHFDITCTEVMTEVIGGVHVAHGTQTGSGTYAPYDDSNCYLSGFPANHYIAGTVWRDPTIASTPNMEVELLLRWSDTNPLRSTIYGDTYSDGYEININQNSDYFQVGRFKGALLQAGTTPPAPQTGDLFEAQIETSGANAVIQCWWTPIATGVRTRHINYTDTAPVLLGQPGIGFYMSNAGGGFNNKLGFKLKRYRRFESYRFIVIKWNHYNQCK